MKMSRWLSSVGFVGMALLAPQLAGCAGDATAEEPEIASTQSALLEDSPALLIDWGGYAFQVDASPTQMQTVASLHLALFDALNAFEGDYASYAYDGPEPAAGASADAAVIQAAFRVLTAFRPGAPGFSLVTPADIAAKRDAGLAAIPDGPGKTAGIALGNAVADAILAARANNGWNPAPINPGGYVPGGGADDYRPTLPGPPQPVLQRAAQFKPFALESSTQFPAPPPPSIDSKKFAKEYAATKSLGRIDSTTRTAEQTAIAQYFTTPAPNASMQLGRELAASLDAYTAARFLGLLSVTVADSLVSVFTSKYEYTRIRPVTLVNDREPGSNWKPLLVTPPHPEYPAAHASIDGAATEVFEEFFGNHYAFTFTNSGATRSWSSFREYAEVGDASRIWAGVHYESAVDAGEKQGKHVGRYVLKNILRREHGRHHRDHHGRPCWHR